MAKSNHLPPSHSLASYSASLLFLAHMYCNLGFPRWLFGKESACNVGDLGSIPGSGRSLGEGNGNPLQYSCLGNPMDRGAWWATLWGCKESDMTEQLSMQARLLCNVVLISAVQQMNQPHAYISPLFEFHSLLLLLPHGQFT